MTFPILKVQAFSFKTRNGVTLVEVLFAMFIAIVGLAGVIALFPLAAKQANDSYSLNQATTASLSIRSTAAADICLPTESRPWCVDDDQSTVLITDNYSPFYGNGRYKAVRSIRDLYQGLFDQAVKRIRDSGAAPNTQAIWRQIYGKGVCYDPLYCASVVSPSYGGSATRDFNKSTMFIRRSTFPFVSENLFVDDITSQTPSYELNTGFGNQINPNNSPTTEPSPQPRLIRVSAWDSSTAFPLRAIVARIEMLGLGDLIQANAQQDNSFGATRDFEGADGTQLLSSSTKKDLSWFATITPIETNTDAIPDQFIMSVVVVRKRDPLIFVPDQTLAGVNSEEEMPQFERVAICGQGGSQSFLPLSSGGLLNVEMLADDRVNPELKVGEYVMLSRTMRVTMPDQATNGPRFIYRHRWYRIAAVSEKAEWPRSVVLQGAPWDYPELTTAAPRAYNDAVHLEATTTATIIPGAIAVYEIPITVSN